MTVRIQYIGKFSGNGAEEVKFGSCDGRGVGEHNGTSFVKISSIFAMHDGLSLWKSII